MKQRIFERFYWQSRGKRVSTNLSLYIGNQLIHGESLYTALLKAANDIDSLSQTKKLIKAAKMIKTGAIIPNVSPKDEFDKSEESLALPDAINDDYRDSSSEENPSDNEALIYESLRGINISERDKFVLSLPIPDKVKGKILKSWSESKYFGSNIINYIYICIGVSVFAYCSLPIFPFIIPQFREILSGFGTVDKNSILNIAYSSFAENYHILPIVLIVFVVFVIISCHLLSSVKKMQEEADFLALLSSVDKEEQYNVLDLVVVKNTFPIYFKKLRIILEKMKSGESIDYSNKNIGLSYYLLWFLQLSFYDSDRTAIKEGSNMLNERIMLHSMSAIKITEVLVVIIQSLVFLSFAYLIFGSLNEIVSRSIAL